MKISFDIEDYTTTYGELFEFFNERRNSEKVTPPFYSGKTVGELCSLFAEAIKKEIDFLAKYAENGEQEVKEREMERVSAYLTTEHAACNKYKYPATEEEADVQRALCLIMSGAYYLIIERLEHNIGRKLDVNEQVFLCASLREVFYQLYQRKHPDKPEDDNSEVGDSEQ